MSETGQKDSDVPFDLPDEDDEVLSSIDQDSSEPIITSSIEFPREGGWTTTSGGSASGSGPHSVPSGSETGRVAELGFQGPGIKEVKRVDTHTFQIGRVHGDIVLDDRFLSPFHCQLRRVGDAYMLEDLGSVNGVYLRIADQLQLEDHDEIITGSQRLIFRTTWDPPPAQVGTHSMGVPVLGAALPSEAARVTVYLSGGLIGATYPVGSELTIGRSGTDLCAPNDPDLSRIHARIVRNEDGYVVRDESSTYGTFVRIHDPVELFNGDCFVVGRTRVSVRYP